MKHLIFGLFALLLTSGNVSKAQCELFPVITPNAPMLCPATQDTLWVQPYDSYQWFKDGLPIAGATNRFLVVDYFLDVPAQFYVRITLDTCTANAAPVLVDGWAFLPPFVASSGNYRFDGNTGESLVCLGDTIFFQLYGPDTLIQWTKDGIDLPGDTMAFLFVTSTIVTPLHIYHVSGSPKLCPNFVQGLGVPLLVRFITCDVGIDDRYTAPVLSVYPNPMKTHITLNADRDIQHVSLSLFDSFGRKLRHQAGLSGQEFQLDRGDLPAGVYYLHLFENNRHFAVEKIVIID